MPNPPRHPYQGGVIAPTVPADVEYHGEGRASGVYRGAPGAPPGAGVPGIPGGAVPGGVPIIFPPEIYPPEGAQYFTADAMAPGLTAANTPVVLPGTIVGSLGLGLAFQVPDNHVAVVRGVTIIVNSMAITTDIRWRLKADKAPIPGWNKTISPRAAGSVEVSFLADFTVVRVPGDGALIELEIQVLDGGTYQAGGTFDGWFWPVPTV